MYEKANIYNLTLTLANTEYAQALSTNARKIFIRERAGTSALKLAYTLGQSGITYITIPIGGSKLVDGVFLQGLTLYLQSPTANVKVEIEEWVTK